MARKRRGGRRGFRFGKYVNLGFKVVGAVVAFGPAIKTVQETGTNYAAIPARLSVNYIGYNPNDGTFDPAKTAAGVGSVIGGLALAKLGSMLARRL